MQAHLIILQQSIISLLSEALHGQSADQISLAHLMATSKSVRNGAIQTLREQFQRMSTAANVPAESQLSITSNPSISDERSNRNQEYCPAAIQLQNGGELHIPGRLRCFDCFWGAKCWPPGDLKPRSHHGFIDLNELTSPLSHSFTKRTNLLSTKKWHISHRFFFKCHLRVESHIECDAKNFPIRPSFGCFFCERKGKLVNFRTGMTFATHIETHSNAEFDADIDIHEL